MKIVYLSTTEIVFLVCSSLVRRLTASQLVTCRGDPPFVVGQLLRLLLPGWRSEEVIKLLVKLRNLLISKEYQLMFE